MALNQAIDGDMDKSYFIYIKPNCGCFSVSPAGDKEGV